MIDTEVEKFTAESAINAGLIGAVQHGETLLIQGSYTLSKDGYLEFKQRNFTFTDKTGDLRTGKFTDTAELINFGRKVFEHKTSE